MAFFPRGEKYLEIITTLSDLSAWVQKTKKQGDSIGLIPTMGFLHEGHISLVDMAKSENTKVVMSIFVNPAQFGPNEDFDRYPRDLERDSALAEAAGTDIIFAPSAAEMYPRESPIQLSAGALADVLCGAKRPGHFDGVLKVVTKLFHLVQPDRAYFGQKDAQQLAIIESLVEDFNFPLAIRRGETIREEDGLAKSSRNVYLSEAERKEAAHLRKALLIGKRAVLNNEDAVQSMTEYLQRNVSGKIDYIELLSYPDLVRNVQNQAILAVAMQFEKARLIDNIIFPVEGKN